MSKNKIIEDLMKLTNIPRDSLRRMTIYDLNNLTKSLNGEKINAPKLNGIEKKPLRKRIVKNRKLKDEPVISDDDFFDDNNENEEQEENENENEEQAETKPEEKQDIKQNIKENNIVNEIIDIPKPSKLTRDVDEKEIVENEIIEEPKPDKAKSIPKPKAKAKKKVVNEKTEVKLIIDKFQKSLTKLITQYKRVRTPNQNHKDKLINFYNKEYDEITAEIEQILDKYMFVDDEIYEWINDLLTGQKTRLVKLIGD